MMRSLFPTTILLLALSLSCGQRNTKPSSIFNEETPVNANDLNNDETPIIKDSVDIVIEQRAEQEFNSTIFAGLRFGSNRQSVERAWKNMDNRTIHVFVDEDVKKVVIRDYDAVYYNGQLASLVLYANEWRLKSALSTLYAKKYGETKNDKWSFSNCEIAIRERSRRQHHSVVDGWMASSKTEYYDNYRGMESKYLTTDPSFLEITYKSKSLLEQIERQKSIVDSLENEKRIKELQKEKEREKQLATEAVSNI